MNQHFILYGYGIPIATVQDNLSIMEADKIETMMREYIKIYNLDHTGRYVAVGDAGDCIIYDNDIIDQMSDSG